MREATKGYARTSPHQPADIEGANGVGDRAETTGDPAGATGCEPRLRAGVVHLRAVTV